ncbi:MAG: hypothetical protein ACPGYV_13210 [Phycisphaeraceae bacterium]
MSYRVVLLPVVEQQILDSALYIAEDSIDRACNGKYRCMNGFVR